MSSFVFVILLLESGSCLLRSYLNSQRQHWSHTAPPRCCTRPQYHTQTWSVFNNGGISRRVTYTFDFLQFLFVPDLLHKRRNGDRCSTNIVIVLRLFLFQWQESSFNVGEGLWVNMPKWYDSHCAMCTLSKVCDPCSFWFLRVPALAHRFHPL